MQKSVQMNTLILIAFLKIVQNFVASLFFIDNKRREQQEHPWCLSSHSDYLGVLSSTFSFLKYMRHSPTRE